MSFRSLSTVFAPLTLSLALACDPELGDDASRADPVANFEQLWGDFDRYYGLFAVKGVDWDALHAEYAPQVRPDSTRAELHAVFADLLGHLGDTHVSLYPAGDPELPVWNHLRVDGVMPAGNYDYELIRRDYLDDHVDGGELVEYGRLAGGLGWIHIKLFDGNRRGWRRTMDDIFAALGDAPGIVVDVRDCPGGLDPLVQYIAGRFAADRRLFMTARKRSGPDRDDFTAPEAWYVEPTDDTYIKPVVLLTSFLTQSAGETFTLAMTTQDHVIHIGEATNGALSDNIMRDLPNGWMFTISVGDYRGPTGASYEGVGVPPDEEVLNTAEEVLAGTDRALERAIARLTGE